jgi:hypothetical protein
MTSGAILMASGRVPKIDKIFVRMVSLALFSWGGQADASPSTCGTAHPALRPGKRFPVASACLVKFRFTRKTYISIPANIFFQRKKCLFQRLTTCDLSILNNFQIQILQRSARKIVKANDHSLFFEIAALCAHSNRLCHTNIVVLTNLGSGITTRFISENSPRQSGISNETKRLMAFPRVMLSPHPGKIPKPRFNFADARGKSTRFDRHPQATVSTGFQGLFRM